MKGKRTSFLIFVTAQLVYVTYFKKSELMENSNERQNIRCCEFAESNGERCSNEVTGAMSYCNKHSGSIEHDIQLYVQVLEHFRQDIREYFVRSNFYFAGETALFFVVLTKGVPKGSSDFLITLAGCVVGIVIAIFWYIVSRGAIIWMDKWRQEAIRIDKLINKFQSYSKLETEMRNKLYNYPAEVTGILPVVFAFIWLILIIFNCLAYFGWIQ